MSQSPPRPQARSPAAALELLADSRDGAITAEQMVELVRAGLATATAERMVADGKSIEVARVRITEVGRQALSQGQ